MMNEIICTFKGKTLVYSKNCSIFVPSNIKLQMDYDISQQFHKEASERKMRKIAESKLSPMNSVDAANYMKRNVEIASHM